MSIETQINRIKSGVQSAYTELENKGATMPTTLNVDNLASTISNMPAGSTTQADWNENDPTSPSYIQNRPFGEREGVLIPESEPIAVDGDGETLAILVYEQPIDIIADGTYTVTLNGTEYICKGIELEGDFAYLGNIWVYGLAMGVPEEELTAMGFIDTGEPFFVVNEGETIICTNIISESYMASIKGPIIDKLESKYLDLELVGKNVEGTVYDIDGDEVTAQMGAEIFNEYYSNKATGYYSHAEGLNTTASDQAAHAEGSGTTASGYSSHAEGGGTTASGYNSHAEGYNTTASGDYSHAEGGSTKATGYSSHAEGATTTASGQYSHAEGRYTTALGNNSHAEGYSRDSAPTDITSSTSNDDIITAWTSANFSLAKGSPSHVEGANCLALGGSSHAEGLCTIASGERSHAEGNSTKASGDASHAEGYYTKASSQYQHVQGKYNVEDTNNTYAHIVGNGTSDTDRSNAHTLDWNGNAWFKGDVYVGGNSQTDGTPIGQLAKKAAHAGISANSNALTTSFMENYLKVANGEAVLEQFVHLSDKVLTMSDLEKGFVISMSEPLEDADGFASGAYVDVMEMPPKAMNEELFTTMVEADGGLIAIAGACFVVPTDNFTLEELVFPKKGIWAPYYVTSLLVHGYNFNDGAGDLLVEVEDVINLGDTLTWDGNTDGRDIIGDPSRGWFKISDQVITVADCADGGTMTLSTGDVIEFTADDVQEDESGFSIRSGVAYFNVPANAAVNASSGIYFLYTDAEYVTSFKINGFNFTTSSTHQEINQKYLPEHLQFGESIVSSTFSWDGNTEGLEVATITSTGSAFAYKITDNIDWINHINFVDNEVNDGFAMKIANAETLITTAYKEEASGVASLYVTIPSTSYKYYVYVIINANDNYFSDNGLSFPGIGTYVNNGSYANSDVVYYIESLTIDGYDGFPDKITEIKQIDPIYLGILNEVEKDIQVGDTLTWNGDTTGRENYVNAFFKVSDTVLTAEDFTNGGSYVLVNNGTETTFEFTSNKVTGTNGFLGIDNSTPLDMLAVMFIFDPEQNGFGVSAGVYFVKTDTAYIKSLTVNGYTFTTKEIYHEIDPKYLPESLQFGEEKTELYGSATVVNGALTWDGNTSGLVSMGNVLYLLSNNVSCIELARKYDDRAYEYIPVTVEYYNNAAGSTSSVAGRFDSDSGIDALWALNTNSPDVDLDLAIVIVTEDNISYGPPEMGITLPKKGIYFASNSTNRIVSLTIDGYDFGASKITPIDEKLLPEMSSFILKSSTPGSTKKFKITVDDSGTLTATEITS